LSTLSAYSKLMPTVKIRNEMTIITTVGLIYQDTVSLTDTFNANRVQCLTLLVHYKYTQLIQQLVRSLEIRVKNKETIKTNGKL